MERRNWAKERTIQYVNRISNPDLRGQKIKLFSISRLSSWHKTQNEKWPQGKE